MKSLLLLLLALSTAMVAHASTPIEELLAPALSGKGAAYFRVVLELRSGMDMRENTMPKELIQSLEKQGASVRPIRTNANVSYWIFFKNGDFATCDVVNDPANSNLPYEKLVPYFSDAPHSGQKWSVEGESLVVGPRYYSVRILTANDPATGGRKGEVEIAIRNSAGRAYYYFGTFISK
jgi:hypothetical protein